MSTIPTVTVSDLRNPEDENSKVESHDLYLRMGDLGLLVNIEAGAGFCWALVYQHESLSHGSRNTNAEGEYLRGTERLVVLMAELREMEQAATDPMVREFLRLANVDLRVAIEHAEKRGF